MTGIFSWSISPGMVNPCLIHRQHLGTQVAVHVHDDKSQVWFTLYAYNSLDLLSCLPQDFTDTALGNDDLSTVESPDLGPECEWEKFKPLGLVKKWLPSCEKHTCGKILLHAKTQIDGLRERMGVRITCFKVGVTSDPPKRFESYLESGYTCMHVIAESSSIDMIHMLEAALIGQYAQHIGCKNKPNSGGEGALNRHVVLPGPFYAYVVAGRADQPRWVGWSLWLGVQL